MKKIENNSTQLALSAQLLQIAIIFTKKEPKKSAFEYNPKKREFYLLQQFFYTTFTFLIKYNANDRQKNHRTDNGHCEGGRGGG